MITPKEFSNNGIKTVQKGSLMMILKKFLNVIKKFKKVPQ